MSSFKRPRKSSGSSTVCFSFQKGECLRGDSCKYEHTAAGANPSADNSAPTKRKTNLGAADVSSEVTAGTGLTQEVCKRFQVRVPVCIYTYIYIYILCVPMSYATFSPLLLTSHSLTHSLTLTGWQVRPRP